MKRNRKRSSNRAEVIPVWTYAQIKKAQPYVTSILRSLRELRLEAQAHDRRARNLERRPGRPDRGTMIALQDATAATNQAKDQFHHTLEELHELSIYCLDPIRGEALVPFAHQEQLAWFIFDSFDPEPLRFWRFHSNPLDTRAPITEAQKQASSAATVA